jgi:ankyrin repeat protein
MLHHYQPNINAICHTYTPLVYAAIHRSESIVKILLTMPQISVNFQNKQGQCTLWCTALQGYTKIIKDLLQYFNIQVDLPEREYGLTPLAAAVAKGHAPIVKRLIHTSQANVNAPDRWRRTLIFHAINRQDLAILQLLLTNNRLHLSWRDDLGCTPLIYSMLKGQTVLTKMLLGHPQAHVDIQDADNQTALWHAVHQGDEELIQLLLNGSSDINARDIEGVTPLYVSIRQENMSLVQKMLSHLHRDHSTAIPGVNYGINTKPPPLCLATS